MPGISSLPPLLASSAPVIEQQSEDKLLLENQHISTRSYSIKRRAEILMAAGPLHLWCPAIQHSPGSASGCWMKHTALCTSLYYGRVQTSLVFSHAGDSAHSGHCCLKVRMSWWVNVTLAVRSLYYTKLNAGRSPSLRRSFIDFKWILGKFTWHNSVQEGVQLGLQLFDQCYCIVFVFRVNIFAWISDLNWEKRISCLPGRKFSLWQGIF